MKVKIEGKEHILRVFSDEALEDGACMPLDIQQTQQHTEPNAVTGEKVKLIDVYISI